MTHKNDDMSLAIRVRAALEDKPSSREVSMFGGVSFMVNDRMVVATDKLGDLLVRIDPERSSELLSRPGAKPAEMGVGRGMGPGWIAVTGATLTDEDLAFWVRVASDFNTQAR